ncbi:MAG: ABC transporter substrate-binding protein [Gemmataceae bacterium]|nr:ABC transporter substrate-binding protein [Gemmataceae bacterium]
MKRLIACLAFLFLGCTNSEGPPLTIGLISPGDDPQRAEAQKQGLELVVKYLGDKADTTLQHRPLVIRFISANSPDEYESQGVRLTSLSRSFALFGGTNVDETERLDHLRVPLFSFAPRRTTSLSESTFTLGLDPEDQAAAIVAWLKSKDVREATMVKPQRSTSDPWATAFPPAWKAQWGEAKTALTIVSDEDKLDAETLIIASAVDDDSPLSKQIGERAKRIVFLGPEAGAKRMAWLRRENREVYWTTAFAIDPQTKTTAEFADKHQRAFGKPPQSDAVLAYDGLKMLLQSMRTTRMASGDRLLKDLETATYNGVTGPVHIEKGRMHRPVFVVHATGEPPAFDYRWTPEPPKNNGPAKK